MTGKQWWVSALAGLSLARGAGAATSDLATEAALQGAGTNRVQLERALELAPPAQRASVRFLVENMPDADRGRLTADFLLRNTALAHEAVDTAPWAGRIPREIFEDAVLPYASVNEDRDDWRPRLRELAVPLVKDCKTPTEAARRLNEKLFPLVKVRYSTERRKADQGPLETMQSGKATCTGLSILLIDACRAVGVPARLVGTPLWTNLRGNHTWVEIWDGDWHFVGAAEPDPAGVDRGWFVHDASQAKRDERRHAIYASSFRRTSTSYPMVWAKDVDWVSAVNVTDRYAPPAKAPAAAGRLLVKVVDPATGKRVAAAVRVHDKDDAAKAWSGTSRTETADLNDILPFEVARDRTYVVEVDLAGRKAITETTIRTNAQDLIVLEPR